MHDYVCTLDCHIEHSFLGYALYNNDFKFAISAIREVDLSFLHRTKGGQRNIRVRGGHERPTWLSQLLII